MSGDNYLTDVGAYPLSPSPYGTLDQGGNVLEWNEAVIEADFRGLRGGAWASAFGDLRADERGRVIPTIGGNLAGFRVATVPEADPTLGGDYNNDGAVDAADYTVWRDNEGAPAGALPNDVDGGVIGLAQYDTWAANYADSLLASTMVPEPGGAALLLPIAWLACGRRRGAGRPHAAAV